MQRASQYIETLIPAMRKLIAKVEAPPKAKKGAAAQQQQQQQQKVTGVQVFIGERFIGWQEAVLGALQQSFEPGSRSFGGEVFGAALEAAKATEGLSGLGEKQVKSTVMPFVKFKMEEAQKGGAQVRGGGLEGVD
jgi:hypothetical protein